MRSGFCSMLRGTIRGEYKPGGSVIVGGVPGSRLSSLIAHEYAHKVLTERTTLGVVAVVCGYVVDYGPVADQIDAAHSYINRFCSKTQWIQEGVATCCEWSFRAQFPDKLGNAKEIFLTYPDPYVKAAEEIGTFAVNLLRRLHAEDELPSPEDVRDVSLGTGLAALSPRLSERFIDDCIANRGSALPELSSVWSRFRAILSCDRAAVLDLMKRKLIDFERSATNPPGTALLVAQCLCETANMSFEIASDVF